MQIPSVSHQNVQVKIGDVAIPFVPQLERVVTALIREINPQPLVGGLSLDRFGVTQEKLNPLLQQLLCFPRQIANHSFAAVNLARRRADIGSLVASGIDSFEPSEPTRYAAAWLELYLRQLREAVDTSRIDFLRSRFGKLPDIADHIFRFTLPKITADPITLSALHAKLPESSIFGRPVKQVPDQQAAVVAELDRASASKESVRGAKLKAIFSEVLNSEFMVSQECRYRELVSFLDTPYGDVLNEREKIVAASYSQLMRQYTQVLLCRSQCSEVVEPNSIPRNLSRDFAIAVPKLLVFETPSFGRVVACENIAAGILVIQGDGFSLFDTAEPFEWQRKNEIL